MFRKKRGLESAFLAPEEAERDDKKRIRRIRKKLRNRDRAEHSRDKTQNVSDSRVKIATENAGESYSNSSTFFSKLQDQVNDGISATKKQSVQESKSTGKKTSQGLKL